MVQLPLAPPPFIVGNGHVSTTEVLQGLTLPFKKLMIQLIGEDDTSTEMLPRPAFPEVDVSAYRGG